MSDSPEDSFPLVPLDSRELVERMDRNLDLLDRLLGEAASAESGPAALGSPTEITISGIELVWCPPGTFLMGSAVDELGRGEDETQHPVTLTRGFWIAKYAITQAQYRAVMKTNPSHFEGDRRPVECVTWDDAMAWCRKMNLISADAPPGCKWSLPSEAQWEYACRAGTTTPFSFGSELNGREANCDGRYPYGTTTKGPSLDWTTEVGSYAGNPWAIHDLHGNVWEWCRDWYGAYSTNSVTDPTGAPQGSLRVARGGSWGSYPSGARSASRFGCIQVFRDMGILGFRPVLGLA